VLLLKPVSNISVQDHSRSPLLHCYNQRSVHRVCKVKVKVNVDLYSAFSWTHF